MLEQLYSAKISTGLLREAGVLAESLGAGQLPDVHPYPGRGPLSVTWHSVRLGPVEEEPNVGFTGFTDVHKPPLRTIHVDVTLRIEPVLRIPLDVHIPEAYLGPSPVPYGTVLPPPRVRRTLPAGEREARFTEAVKTRVEHGMLIVGGGVVSFHSAG